MLKSFASGLHEEWSKRVDECALARMSQLKSGQARRCWTLVPGRAPARTD